MNGIIRRVVVIAGSKNDLIKKGRAAIKYLIDKRDKGAVEIVGIHVSSCHRQPKSTRELVKKYHEKCNIDFILAIAGKAADLPGFIDAYLRNELYDYRIGVIGVGLPGATLRDTLAAELSITDIPGNQVIYAGQSILEGCVMACDYPVPEIKININPSAEDFESLEQILAMTEEEEEEPKNGLLITADQVISVYEAMQMAFPKS